jgi:hypothetical protein
MADLPFDSVLIDPGTEQRLLSAYEFMRLPLPDRIRYILERRIEFRKGTLTIERSVGLQSLMGSTGGDPSKP